VIVGRLDDGNAGASVGPVFDGLGAGILGARVVESTLGDCSPAGVAAGEVGVDTGKTDTGTLGTSVAPRPQPTTDSATAMTMTAMLAPSNRIRRTL